jgi:type 1 fimbria pilin
MKKYYITFALFCAVCSIDAQVNFGGTSISSPSVSLEFGQGNKGIVLPWVTSKDDVTTAGVVDGTLIFDSSDKKVKVRSNNAWVDLTLDSTGTVDLSLQSSKTEHSSAKVVIGSNGGADTTLGILVLSDTNKAMVLPKVASPHLNIVKPASGMMVYDTAAHQLAVYNGNVWTFWKP